MKKSRDLKKTITYRTISLITTAITIFFLTGSWQISVYGTLIIETMKFIQYYLFEKVWKWKLKENT